MNNEFKRMQKLAGLITENTDMGGDSSKLEKMLKSHDWYFRMSDDDRSYDRGKREEDEIKKLVSTLGEEGKELYDKYKKEAGIKEGEGAYEYEKGKETGEKIEKEKMSKSKLRNKIREMIVAELDGAAVEAEDYDPVYEAKKKSKGEDDEDIDIEDIDVDVETDAPDMEMGGGEDLEVEHIQDLLNQLQDAAEKLGDEKLLKQVGNTITFFTRQHVADKPELNEASLEAIERMDGLAPQNSVSMLIRGAQGIIRDLKEEGFDDDDIYDYIIERIKILA